MVAIVAQALPFDFKAGRLGSVACLGYASHVGCDRIPGFSAVILYLVFTGFSA
jgi:hypothetical protein